MAKLPAMTEADRQLVSEAVAAAEMLSAGEIVTIVTPRSDSYRDVTLIWSAIVAFVALCALEIFPGFYLGLVERVLGLWAFEWTPRLVLGLALTVATLKFAGTYLILRYTPLGLWLTPRRVRNARVRERALTCFRVGAESRTSGAHRRADLPEPCRASRRDHCRCGDCLKGLARDLGACDEGHA